jgi:hypothetical protein
MRRAVVALLAVAGAVVPALVAGVWLFGCCVLPFHAVMHQLMPICQLSMAMVQGSDAHSSDQTTTPPPWKQDSARNFAPELTTRLSFRASSLSPAVASATPAAYRSRISLGAMRCDSDVGLHTLLVTWLI